MTLKEFEKFFIDNFQSASLVAYRYIGDQAVVEDIVQESFITVWEKRSEIFIDKQNLKKYLLVTVRNRSISYLRSIKIKHINLDTSLEMDQEEEEEIFPEEELAIRVSKAIQKLPLKCKEIFLLSYIEGLTYQAIAEKQSITKNTVKTQMGIAYRILREELKDVYVSALLFIMFRNIREEL